MGKIADTRGSAVRELEGGGPTGVGGWTVIWTVGLTAPGTGSELNGAVVEVEKTAGCSRTWGCSDAERKEEFKSQLSDFCGCELVGLGTSIICFSTSAKETAFLRTGRAASGMTGSTDGLEAA